MPTYRHYCYRAHWLDLEDTARLQLERVFAMNRFLENHYVTRYQNVENNRIDPEALSLSALWNAIASIHAPSALTCFADVESVFVESTLIQIAHQWKKVLEHDAPRPEFRKLTDDQVIWMFDTKAIDLFRDTFKIPGVEGIYTLPIPKVRLFGEPVCYCLHRTKEGQYYVVFLYERMMHFPFVHSDPSINALGYRVQSLLCPNDQEADCTSETLADVAILRMRILVKLLAARETKGRRPRAVPGEEPDLTPLLKEPA